MSDPQQLYAEAASRYRARDFGAAESSFRRLLEVLPPTDANRRARALYGLAISLIGEGRDEQARPHLEAALRSNPGLQRARDRLAEIDARATQVEPRPVLAVQPSPHAVYGVATGCVRTTEQDPLTRGTIVVVSFRVDRRDVAPGSAPPVPVELRGRRVTGVVRNGDWVQLAPASHGGAVSGVTNLVTGERVSSSERITLRTVAVVVVSVFVIAWIAMAFVAVALQKTPRELFDALF